ncbi:MAG: DUF1211 domain-containing protein [Eubacteriaceae bacterium]|jgi:Predicted integral membrane protein|nr:DUF1211 domain-containing protein [Eubacteriaceae bacterium]
MKTQRIQAFSDGIFAILITILVLEFKLPNYANGSLCQAVFKQWPIFAAYLMTYAYIGILWLFHHDIFGFVKKTNAKLNILNLFSIFLTTLLSYSMVLLSESMATFNRNDMMFSIALYSLLAFGISMSYLIIYSFLSKNSDFLAKTDDAVSIKKMRIYPLVSSLIYLMTFILAMISVSASGVFLIAGLSFHVYAYWKNAMN